MKMVILNNVNKDALVLTKVHKNIIKYQQEQPHYRNTRKLTTKLDL